MTRVPRQPQTTTAPNPATLFTPPTSTDPPSSSMSSTTTSVGPEPTPLPPHFTHDEPPEQVVEPDETARHFKVPKLRLIIEDLSHPGAARFLAAGNCSSVFEKSVQVVLQHLYKKPSASVPGTRSVTLYLEAMDGVAYTTGSSLDNDHKEIHFSLGYIKGVKKAPEGAVGDVTGAYEIAGVLVHELVHCFQHNGHGTCPGGLIEGIADWVRLRARLGAVHWKRDRLPERWDQGYEKTAYFLDWIEHKYGEGSVRRINHKLQKEEYVETDFWDDLFGCDVDTLWEKYVRTVKSESPACC